MLFFLARFSGPVIQRVYLVRRRQPVHVGNCFAQRDVLLLFAQLFQIALVQSEHVRFELGGILGEGALFLDMAPDVVCKQLIRVSVQLIPELLKRLAVLGMQLQILLDFALVSQRQVLKLQLVIDAMQILEALVIGVAKFEAHAGAALAANQPWKVVGRIHRGVNLSQHGQIDVGETQRQPQ